MSNALRLRVRLVALDVALALHLWSHRVSPMAARATGRLVDWAIVRASAATDWGPPIAADEAEGGPW